MTTEFQVAKDVATHPATVVAGAVSLIGWLANKVWRGQRLEIANIKDALEKLGEKLEQHQERDEELFREVTRRMDDHHAEILRALGGKANRR
jgi:hypothetical protein